MAHHEDAENRRAGYVYIMMASFGTLALLLAFGLLAGPDGNYTFAGVAEVARAQWAPPIVLLLALLGAGSKAGLVPLHVWLPLAHPAAPSHVSALMSGVMTKVSACSCSASASASTASTCRRSTFSGESGDEHAARRSAIKR